MSCAQPWKAPAYIGPSRPCMCAITLCSAWPDDQRQGEEGDHHREHPDQHLKPDRHQRSPLAGSSRPTRPAPARPAGACGARRAALGSCDSPGSFAPGQGFATRDARTNSLRSGYPSNSGRQQQRHEAARMPGEVDAEHLVGLPFVPRRARKNVHNGRYRWRRARSQGTQQDAGTLRRSTRGERRSGSPSASSSTADSQSKKSYPSSSRADRTAPAQRSTGTSTVSRDQAPPSDDEAAPPSRVAISSGVMKGS